MANRDNQLVDIDLRIAELTREIAAQPSNAFAYRSRGLLYGRQGEYDKAILDFDEALSLTPNDARALGFRGIVRQRRNDHGRAIADFSRAIELDPDNAALYTEYRQRSLEANKSSTHPSQNSTANASRSGAFNLLLNPFVLLSITPNATAQTIRQAYEDAVEDGIASNEDLQRAQQILLTPRLRVDAELGGFLDIAPRTADQILSELKRGATYEALAGRLSTLHALPRSNLLSHLGAISPLGVDALNQLLEAQTTVAVGALCDAVNECRAEAGSGKIDREAIAEALARLQERQTKVVVETLVSHPDFTERFVEFVKRTLSKADPVQITQLGSYIKAYNLAVAPELSRRRERVLSACNSVRSNPNNPEAVNEIALSLHSWNEIARPSQLFEAHLNREEPQARDLYILVRDLCIWLANEENEYKIAREITKTCADVFDKLPRAIGQMEEEGATLERLQNEQAAIALLTPLSNAFEEAQQNHRKLETELLKGGFGLSSGGIAKKLFVEFAKAVRAAKATDFADAPWRMIREIAISLNNDSRSSKAAATIIHGLLDFSSTDPPSEELVETLRQDKKAAEKNADQAELDSAIRDSRWTTAIPLLDRLLTIVSDPEEVAALRGIRETISAKRQSQVMMRWGWAAAAVVVLIIIFANQNNSSTYSTAPQYSPPTQYSTAPQYSPPTQYSPAPQSSIPAPSFPPNQGAPNTSTTLSTAQPPVATNLEFTRANIRYCAFQEVVLEAARPLIHTESANLAFNAVVDDWNSRCSSYRYRESDKAAVEADLIGQRAALEAKGRAYADIWVTAPTFSKVALTITTPNGQRPLAFIVELALTAKEWSWGTSFRTSMPSDAGMLYVYPSPKVISQSMVTAYVPLDVLFIDESGVITEIIPSRPARTGDSATSKSREKAMLELKGGTADRLGIKVGDVIHTSALGGTMSRNN